MLYTRQCHDVTHTQNILQKGWNYCTKRYKCIHISKPTFLTVPHYGLDVSYCKKASK